MERIGNYAFADCSALIRVDIPKAIVIGEGAFARYDTYGSGPIFSEIILPDSLTEIHDGAFIGCESLVEITIPEGVTHFGDYTFAYCLNLERLYVVDPVFVFIS